MGTPTQATSTSHGRILMVEDDPALPRMVAIHLAELGYELEVASDGEEGVQRACAEHFVLMILDVMLPGADGFEVCRRLRSLRPHLPILMLTARRDEVDRVLGLEIGADDYLTKPFSMRELSARVRAILRRVESAATRAGQPHASLLLGSLRMDPLTRRVVIAGTPVELTLKEFDLLYLLASHPGRAFSRIELLEKVWGYQYEGYQFTVNSHINRLRAKVEPDPAHPRLVLTVWGIGYRCAEPAGPDES